MNLEPLNDPSSRYELRLAGQPIPEKDENDQHKLHSFKSSYITSRNSNDRLDAADNLRANSKLTAGEYRMPVLGVIILRHISGEIVV